MLTAFKITTESGYCWETSMSADTTLEDAKSYFLGQSLDVGLYNERIEKVVSVEQTLSCCEDSFFAQFLRSPCPKKVAAPSRNA